MPRARSALLVALLALAACGGDDGGDDGAAAPLPGGELVVELVEQAGSGQTGTATLTPTGDGTMVTTETVSYLVDPQPAAIRRGTCAQLGPEMAYPLPTIEDGISVATLDVPLDELQTGELAVVVAESRTKPDTVVACGAIPAAQR